MKKVLIICVVSLALTACGGLSLPKKKPVTTRPAPIEKVTPTQPVQQVKPEKPEQPVYEEDAKKILHEAERLSDLVRRNILTRVQAAQALDRYRSELVGHNQIDDASFSLYLQVAVERQSGKIDASEAEQKMKQGLNVLKNRWSTMGNKPENPAFTNFLLLVFHMPPLS